MDVPGCWEAMVHAIRNLGRPGIASMAIAAVDVALWDLKARLLDVSLVTLLGAVRDAVPVYGSGGFTSYPLERLQAQLGGWVAQGIPRVKMKIGTHPAGRPGAGPRGPRGHRPGRRALRGRQRRLQPQTGAGAGRGVPRVRRGVVRGAGLVRRSGRAAPDPRSRRRRAWTSPRASTATTSGTSAVCWRPGAVDVLQADGSRCAGITGFLRAAALTESRSMALSAHCAPSLHVQRVLRHRAAQPDRVFPRSRRASSRCSSRAR